MIDFFRNLLPSWSSYSLSSRQAPNLENGVKRQDKNTGVSCDNQQTPFLFRTLNSGHLLNQSRCQINVDNSRLQIASGQTPIFSRRTPMKRNFHSTLLPGIQEADHLPHSNMSMCFSQCAPSQDSLLPPTAKRRCTTSKATPLTSLQPNRPIEKDVYAMFLDLCNKGQPQPPQPKSRTPRRLNGTFSTLRQKSALRSTAFPSLIMFPEPRSSSFPHPVNPFSQVQSQESLVSKLQLLTASLRGQQSQTGTSCLSPRNDSTVDGSQCETSPISTPNSFSSTMLREQEPVSENPFHVNPHSLDARQQEKAIRSEPHSVEDFPRRESTNAFGDAEITISSGESHESGISLAGSPRGTLGGCASEEEGGTAPSSVTLESMAPSSSSYFLKAIDAGVSTCNQLLSSLHLSKSYQQQKWLASETESQEAVKFWKEKTVERRNGDVDKITKRLNRILRDRPEYDSLYLSKLYELEPEEEEEEVLPELTSEMQTVIRRYLSQSENSVVVEAFRLTILVKDLRTLCGLNWLSDQIINYYMQLIQHRSEENANLPKVVVASTFFYTKLSSAGFTGVRRWTRNSNILQKDLFLVPIHMGIHWCMLAVDVKKRQITFYDSMGHKNDQCLAHMRDFIVEEAADKEKMQMDASEWQLVNAGESCPQQNNGSDCGVFSCICAEYLSRGRPLSYSQEQMPYFRQRMMFEIISKHFV